MSYLLNGAPLWSERGAEGKAPGPHHCDAAPPEGRPGQVCHVCRLPPPPLAPSDTLDSDFPNTSEGAIGSLCPPNVVPATSDTVMVGLNYLKNTFKIDLEYCILQYIYYF